MLDARSPEEVMKGAVFHFALQEYVRSGCTFLRRGLCALHGMGFEPLKCLFCHHDRIGQGSVCHSALEADWDSAAGWRLVSGWIARVGLLKRYGGEKRCPPSEGFWARRKKVAREFARLEPAAACVVQWEKSAWRKRDGACTN